MDFRLDSFSAREGPVTIKWRQVDEERIRPIKMISDGFDSGRRDEVPVGNFFSVSRV
jgi:hypothetical protein